MVTVERLGQTAVDGDQVVFRLADADHGRAGVRLWSDLDLGTGLDLHRVRAGWELRMPLPPVDCLEYMFEVDGSLGLDPTNPETVDGAFGAHSWLAMPGYRPPAWLDLEPVPGDRSPFRSDVTVWQPESASATDRLPLLIAHDGPEIDALGELTRYVAALIGSGELPSMRVALFAPGPRDDRYAANPAYAALLTGRAIPRLLRLLPSEHRPVLTGQSLGAVAALHAAWSAPDTFAGLFLQSGSFFTPQLDPQERGFSRFAEVTAFVERVHSSHAQPGLPPIAMTCGTAEENLANNRQMHATLQELGVDVKWGEVRQGHTWMCWRDLLHPHLTDLLHKVWS